MIDVAVFSSKSYDEMSFSKVNQEHGFSLHFHEFPLNIKTAKMAMIETVDKNFNERIFPPLSFVFPKFHLTVKFIPGKSANQ